MGGGISFKSTNIYVSQRTNNLLFSGGLVRELKVQMYPEYTLGLFCFVYKCSSICKTRFFPFIGTFGHLYFSFDNQGTCNYLALLNYVL